MGIGGRSSLTPQAFEAGSVSSEYTAAPGRGEVILDDFVSPLTAETYYTTRLQPVVDLYLNKSPELAGLNNLLEMGVFVLGCLASILGAFDCSETIPVIFACVALLQTIMAYYNPRTHLNATNRALAGLRAMQMEWEALSNVDRRVASFKERLFLTAENLVLDVMQAWVGSVAVKGDDTAESRGPETEKKKKGEGKEKNQQKAK